MHLHTAPGPTVDLRATRDNPTDAIVSSVLDKLAHAVTTGHWNRLGACARCRRVFYDNTRNGGKRWCLMYAGGPDGRACGTIAKVRRYRTRQAATTE